MFQKGIWIKRMLVKFDYRRYFIITVVKFVVAFRHNLTRIKFFFVHYSQKHLSGIGKYNQNHIFILILYSNIYQVSSSNYHVKKSFP